MEKQLKLLISEENNEWSREAGRVFQEMGLDPIYVRKDGLQVLEKIEEERPDLVLMDLFMPGLDAIGVIHAAKKSLGEESPRFFVKSSNGK